MVVDNNDGSAPTLVLDNLTGATSATDNDLNYITNCDAGLMQLELTAANTNHAGKRAMLTITDATNHVPVFHEFMILVANVYDALIGTDYLQVDSVQIEGADATDTIGIAQTGDSFARIGATGSALTSLAQATELALVPKSTGSLTLNATCSSDIKSGLSTQAELNKVPKSDNGVTFNATALADIGGSAWDAVIADHLDAGSTGELLQDIDYEVDVIHDTILDLAVTGAPLNTVANGRTLNSGTVETSGTYASTEFSNGVYHVLTAAGVTPNGIIDIEYLVTLPNSMAVPTSIELEGYLKESPAGGGDSVNLQIYNYVNPGWDIIMPVLFTGIVTDGPSNITNHNLLYRHVGTVGGDIGKMRIRIYSNSLETGTTLNIDKLNVGYAEAVSSSITAILEDTGTTLPTQIGTPMQAGAEVVLANSADHGGAATVITAKAIAVTNSDAGGVAVSLTGSGTGNSHAISLASTSGSAISAVSGSHGINVVSSAGKGLIVSGATGDIDADIAGTITTVTTVTNMLTAADVKTAMEANNSDLDYLVTDLINKKEITIADGATKQYTDAGVLIGTIATAYSDDGTTVTRKAMRQVK